MYMTSFKPRPSPFTATPQEKGDAQKGQVTQAATQPDAPLLSSLVFSGVESSRCLSLSPGKDYRFSVVCNTRRLHCFPVLVSVVSSALLRMLNQAQCIRTERSAPHLVSAGFARLPSWAVE